ncbi:MAG: glutathione S-transferase family protein, partial [Pseudomonadota bacterium]
MILVGQYDSPFVRRAAVALHLHGIAFERRVHSVFTHLEEIRAVNPLGKVPVLILEDGSALPDSRAIIEWLEARAPRMTLAEPTEMLAIEAVAIGLAEKTYERGIETSRRAVQDPGWTARLEGQIASALAWLEARASGPFMVGDALTRAD